MDKQVTISNGPKWHKAISVPHATKIINEHRWRVEKAMADHRRIHGWKVTEVPTPEVSDGSCGSSKTN